MWPLAPTDGGAEARLGGGYSTPHWESGGFHRTLLRPPQGSCSPHPHVFFLLLVLNGKEGRGEEERVDTKASEKMCKLPVGSQAETDWIS